MTRKSPHLVTLLLLLLALAGFLFFHIAVTRPDLDPSGTWKSFATPALVFGALSAFYLLILLLPLRSSDEKYLLGFSVLVRVALVFVLPHFSDDFYRFLWDGRMSAAGLNPFDYTPHQARDLGLAPAAWQDIYPHLNSKDYYTVYPPVLQTWFWLSALLFPLNLTGQVIVLKAGVVIAELFSIWFLHKLCAHYQLHRKAVLLYALNPLVIVELSGNLHFEAWMICFTLGALWMLTRKQLWPAALLIALAVGSKLLPLMFVPFLLPRLGWKKMLVFCLLLAVFLILIFIPVFIQHRWQHILESLHLYFRYFEFNAGPQHWGRKWAGDENKELFLLRFPQMVAVVLLAGMVLDRNKNLLRLGGSWLMALGFYQLTSSTVHPWYIVPLIALGAVSGYRWPVLWGFWMLFTYWFYYLPGFVPPRWFINLEYASVLLLALPEWLFTARGTTLEQWLWRTKLFRRIFRSTIPGRLRIKEQRIASLLPPDASVVDIGCGNGGLAHALKQRGFSVTPVDVKQISFFEDVAPVIYDGKRLPFADRSFGTALLITVLHHTPDPDAILREAGRVAPRIIVMEDIFRNAFQKYLTFFTDSLVNMEFRGHPHTNRNEAGWQDTFARLGMRVTHRAQFRTLLFFTQVIYVVEINH